jgi:cytochrome c553
MTVKITWRRAIAALLALLLGGLALAWSGLVPIAASSGHWPITDWFLHWTMQNSARTYGSFQTPEQVREDAALVSAAGHFRQACQVCHGAPGEPPSPAMQAATPPAPNLADTGGHYSDRELFWIVQHGIKYTGMPAWPKADRPDEVRRMVGFIRRMPTLSAQDYRALTQPAPASGGAPALERCTGCHGTDGMGRGQPDMPILAGQSAGYLARSLRQHAAGKGSSAVMQVAASGLSETEIKAMATYFAGLPGLRDEPLPGSHPIVAMGLPGRQLPACTSCHAPGRGAPLIAGQRADYIAARLRQWRGEDAVIDAAKPQDVMAVIARRIPEDEIDALARSLAAPSPARPAKSR